MLQDGVKFFKLLRLSSVLQQLKFCISPVQSLIRVTQWLFCFDVLNVSYYTFLGFL